MAGEVKLPIGKGIVAMLVGFSILPVTIPTAYFFALSGTIKWFEVFSFGFLLPMLVIGVPYASGSFDHLPESVGRAWVIETVVGLPSLTIAMQFYDPTNPGSVTNTYAMAGVLTIIAVAIATNQYTDSKIIDNLYRALTE